MISKLFNNLESLKLVLNNYSGSAHIKTVADGKYIYSNDINVKKFGLNRPEDIYGLTIKDLNSKMSKRWGSVGDIAHEIEKIVIQSKKEVVDVGRIFLTANGLIYKHKMIKIPFFSDGIVTEIITLSENMADGLPLMELYALYKSIYSINPRKGKAIQKFLEHVGIVNYFDILPTDAELKVLIASKDASTHKETAFILSSSSKTIDTHLGNLRKK